MTEQNGNLVDIPTIGTSQIGSNPNPAQGKKTFEKPDVAMFDNAPSDVTIGSFFGRIVVGLIVGLCAVALLFGSLAAVGGMAGLNQENSILRIIFPVIGFVVNFVGSLALALMYNIFFSKRYYNFSKMAGLIFVSSLILLVFSFVFYLKYKNTADLYIVLGFQILFGLYFSLNLMDFMSQPNYSASSMMGNTLGCILAVLAYLFAMSLIDNNLIYYSILPVILSYSIMILGAGIWDAVYYKLYEWGNNPLYLPSLTELREERQKEEKEKEKEEEEVNVEME